MPKKKTTKKPAPKTQSKAAFVRSLPSSTPAKDVVEKAKAAGIKLTDAYVYNVRATTRAAKKPKVTTAKAATSRGTAHSTSNETTFRKLVLDLGIARSKMLLAEVERGIAAVIAGR